MKIPTYLSILLMAVGIGLAYAGLRDWAPTETLTLPEPTAQPPKPIELLVST